MTFLRPFAALALPLMLAACGGIDLKKIREQSLTDRCADFMQQAFPEAEMEVTGEQTLPVEAQQSFATVRVAVEARRQKLPANSKLPRDLAAECRFDQGLLAEFHWTKGPLP